MGAVCILERWRGDAAKVVQRRHQTWGWTRRKLAFNLQVLGSCGRLLRRECPVFYEGKTDSGRLCRQKSAWFLFVIK